MPEIQFKGKEFVYNHHLSVPYRPLETDPTKSIGSNSLNGNLVIQGDNLHALKALLPMYSGRVDCIFIDPPYNTGNEGWAYNDNVNSPMIKEWMDSNPIDKDDMLRHDKWLTLMLPRIRLLHELLSETGSFWMTLDDNEVHFAKCLCDEIFGERNFVDCITWQKKVSPSNDAQWFSSDHDYILVYAKDKTFWRPNSQELSDKQKAAYYKNPDKDPRGDWNSATYTCNKTASERPNLFYAIKNPNTGEEVWPKETAVWKYAKEQSDKHVEENLLYWGVDGKSTAPRIKKFLADADKVVPRSIWNYSEVGHTQEATQELNNFGLSVNFSTPKPSRLIKKILSLATNEDSIILDSFAGSGTTAQAVLELNRIDSGNRKFILVECEEYADRLTAERVSKVINGYSFSGIKREVLYSENITFQTIRSPQKIIETIQSIENLESHRFEKIKKEVKEGRLTVFGESRIAETAEGTGGTFTYCTLGEPIDVDGILTGRNLPKFDSLGAWLFHTATGETLDVTAVEEDNWFLGENESYCTWLIYKPDLEFLKSSAAALTLDFAEKIAERRDKKHLVFAPAKFVPNKVLLPLGVEYAPLPFALYRVEK